MMNKVGIFSPNCFDDLSKNHIFASINDPTLANREMDRTQMNMIIKQNKLLVLMTYHPIYTLTGQCLKSTPTQPGIYIVGGKKYLNNRKIQNSQNIPNTPNSPK